MEIQNPCQYEEGITSINGLVGDITLEGEANHNITLTQAGNIITIHNFTVSDTPPANPVINQLWYDLS